MREYPRVRSVFALPGKKLKVTFENGDTRTYDCNPLLAKQPFALLVSDAFFRAVRADRHGYGVIWSDDIDLSESELWLNGVPETADGPQHR